MEVLLIAQKLGIPMAEVAVNWHEVDGSKLEPLWSSIQMARDLIRIRLKYMLRLWRL